MKLEQLELENFRKFKELNIKFNDGLNVFVGENNAGKTAIIDAIRLVLDTNSAEYNNIDENDFFDSKNELKIRLIFKIENDNDGGIFLEYLTYEDSGNAKLYLTLTANKDIANRQGFIRKNIKTGKDGNGKELEYEIKELLNITYLKPLRDAENELIAGKDSRLSKILQGYFNCNKEAFDNNPELKYFIEEIKKFNNELLNNINKIKIKNNKLGFKDQIKMDYLDKICLNEEDILIKFAESDKDEQIFKNLLKKLDLVYNTKGKQGLGYQNLLFMSAEMLLLNHEEDSPSKIIAIEEPEAHLHPQHQIKLLNFIKNEKNLQIFITTHSPNLTSQVPIESIFYCKDDKVYPINKTETGLEEDDIKFLEKFLDTTKSDLFFAKGLIFVEGISEQLVLPEIAKIMDFSLDENGVSIINIGNTAFKRFAKIFKNKEGGERIKIPISFIRDLDIEEINSENKNKEHTKLKEDLESKNSEFHKVFISEYRTFEYDWYYKNKEILLKAIKETYEIPSNFALTNESSIVVVYNTIKDRQKSEVAYRLAKLLEEKQNKIYRLAKLLEEKQNEIRCNEKKYIPEYLINAINHIKTTLKSGKNE